MFLYSQTFVFNGKKEHFYVHKLVTSFASMIKKPSEWDHVFTVFFQWLDNDGLISPLLSPPQSLVKMVFILMLKEQILQPNLKHLIYPEVG